jgi:hypothetical protein
MRKVESFWKINVKAHILTETYSLAISDDHAKRRAMAGLSLTSQTCYMTHYPGRTSHHEHAAYI